MLGSICRGVCVVIVLATGTAATQEHSFDDPLFRRCISWMMTGYRGALIQNNCLDEYGIPPPSLFLCARKVQIGFVSPGDRESCAIIFDEQAKKIRAGYIK